MRYAICTLIIAASLYGPAPVQCATLDFAGAGFSTVLDAGGTQNISVDSGGLHLGTVTNSLDLNAGTVNALADVYRGEVSFQTLDDDGPYWIEWAKDDHDAVGGTGGFFEDNVDECLLADRLDGVIQALGTGQGNVYDTENGTRFRIGPYPSGATPVSTASPGSSILPAAWSTSHRANALSFMTTGAHNDDRENTTTSQSYTVFIDYAGSSDDVAYTIPIPRDNLSGTSAFLDSSSGDPICNLGTADVWCVRPQSTSAATNLVGSTGCACDGTMGFGTGTDDRCVLLEVSVAIDFTLQLDDITIDWTDYDSGSASSGLNGPFAVTMAIEEATYDDLFTYRGRFWSVTSLDAGVQSVWDQISWDQTGSEGQARVAFDCGDVSDGRDFTRADWGEDNGDFYPFQDPANAVATFAMASATATVVDPPAYQNHCFGRYSLFEVYLIDTFAPDGAGADPTVGALSLRYHPDGDGDESPLSTFEGSYPADCDDTNANIRPDAADFPGDDLDQNCSGTLVCYLDEDNDGFGGPLTVESTYTATGGVANQAGACGSTTNDGYDDEFNDCNDRDSSQFPGQTWYPDCDGDGAYSDLSVISCSTPTGTAACNDVQDPDGGWSIEGGFDCNDESAAQNPGALEVCDFLDNNCNGLTDDNDPGVVDQILWYRDADEDDFGSAAVTQVACDMPSGFVLDCSDCNDSDDSSATGCELPFFKDGFESSVQ